MPTTLPLDPGDDAEGQLKPIAEFAQPAPPQPAAAVHAPVVHAPQPTPAAAPAATAAVPAARPVQSAPASPSAMPRTSLHAPSLSLNRKHAEVAAPTHTVAAAAQSARLFTDAELLQAWTHYIDNHAADRLLVNTMRVSLPQRTAVANTFEMVVESEIQVELINEAMPALLADLRASLQNDLLSIHVRANNGASSPMTWNEREVLANMIERHPSIKDFVEELGLSLL